MEGRWVDAEYSDGVREHPLAGDVFSLNDGRALKVLEVGDRQENGKYPCRVIELTTHDTA